MKKFMIGCLFLLMGCDSNNHYNSIKKYQCTVEQNKDVEKFYKLCTEDIVDSYCLTWAIESNCNLREEFKTGEIKCEN